MAGFSWNGTSQRSEIRKKLLRQRQRKSAKPSDFFLAKQKARPKPCLPCKNPRFTSICDEQKIPNQAVHFPAEPSSPAQECCSSRCIPVGCSPDAGLFQGHLSGHQESPERSGWY